MTEKKISSKELAQLCSQIADDRKAENVLILSMNELSSIADYFVLCTANNEPHLKAVAERIARGVREKHNIRPRSVEGTAASEWMLLDYGNVLVHIMTEESRSNYQLESLWADAPEIEALETIRKVSTGN